MSRWKPNTTVATLVYQEGRFLLVEEYDKLDRPGMRVLNQPAGHVEEGEPLLQAALRETLEETGWDVEIEAYLGLYINEAPQQITFFRHCFIARPVTFHPERPLDTGIIQTHWLTHEELLEADRQQRLRSPMVLPCCLDFLAGRRYPLDFIRDFR